MATKKKRESTVETAENNVTETVEKTEKNVTDFAGTGTAEVSTAKDVKPSTSKKLSITKLDKILKTYTAEKVSAVTYHVSDTEDIEVYVKRFISCNEMRDFVSLVVEAVYDDEGNYIPAYYRTAFAMAYLDLYTSVKMESGVDRVIAMMYDTNIIGDLMKNSSADQLFDLERAIDEEIEYRNKVALSGERIRLNYVIEQLDKAMPMLEQNASLLSGVSAEDMTTAVRAMGNMDEEKLASSVLKMTEDNVIHIPTKKKTASRKKKAEDVD